jgi:hypothetical protein
MNIIGENGKIKETLDVHGLYYNLVYTGNVSRILASLKINPVYIVAYVERNMYDIFYRRKITEDMVNFVHDKYPETYMYEFLKENVGYTLKLDRTVNTVLYSSLADTYDLYKELLGKKKTGKKYLAELAKIKGLQCYRILLTIVNGKKPVELESFLEFRVERVHDEDLEYTLKSLMDTQLDISTVLEEAIVNYNSCTTPLELMHWYDKYSPIYTKVFGIGSPNANEMVNTFFYSTEGNTIPNHDNIKVVM